MAGRTVVVGAGLAGLSAAIHLAAAGREVVVVVAGKSNISTVELTGVTRFKESRIRKEITTKPGDAPFQPLARRSW